MESKSERDIFDNFRNDSPRQRFMRKLRRKCSKIVDDVLTGNLRISPLKFSLDENQIELVTSEEKNIVAVSEAGSGKTTAAILRVTHMIGKRSIPPESILGLSFTVQGRNNFETGFNKLVNDGVALSEGYSPRFLTFHQFASDIIVKFANKVRTTNSSNEHDEHDESKKIKFISEEDLEKELKKIKKRNYLFDVTKSEMKRLLHESRYQKSENKNAELRPLHKVVFDSYQNFIESKNNSRNEYFDYFGILLESNDGLIDGIDLDWLRHVIVEEAQDTNKPCFSIIKTLLDKQYIESVASVGDPWQEINSFAGLGLDGFESEFSSLSSPRDLKIVRISNNYRCHENIRIGANALKSGVPVKYVPDDFDFRIFHWSSRNSNMTITDQYEIMNILIPKFLDKGKEVFVLFRRNNEVKSLKKYGRKKDWSWITDIDIMSDEALSDEEVQSAFVNNGHQAKSLECDVLYICNVFEMNIPYYRERDANPKESIFGDSLETIIRRELYWFYMCLTRARDLAIMFKPSIVKKDRAFPKWRGKTQMSDFVEMLGECVAHVYSLSEFLEYPRNYIRRNQDN